MLEEEKRLTEEIQELLEKAEAIDEQEDNRYCQLVTVCGTHDNNLNLGRHTGQIRL